MLSDATTAPVYDEATVRQSAWHMFVFRRVAEYSTRDEWVPLDTVVVTLTPGREPRVQEALAEMVAVGFLDEDDATWRPTRKGRLAYLDWLKVNGPG